MCIARSLHWFSTKKYFYMILSKVISTTIEKGRLIVKILGFGSSDFKTPYNISPFGIDSNVTKGYRAIYADTENDGEKVLVGVLMKNAIAQVSETRLYSEDSNGLSTRHLH